MKKTIVSILVSISMYSSFATTPISTYKQLNNNTTFMNIIDQFKDVELLSNFYNRLNQKKELINTMDYLTIAYLLTLFHNVDRHNPHYWKNNKTNTSFSISEFEKYTSIVEHEIPQFKNAPCLKEFLFSVHKNLTSHHAFILTLLHNIYLTALFPKAKNISKDLEYSYVLFQEAYQNVIKR